MFAFERYLEGSENKDVDYVAYEYFREAEMRGNIETRRIKEVNRKKAKGIL